MWPYILGSRSRETKKNLLTLLINTAAVVLVIASATASIFSSTDTILGVTLDQVVTLI